MSLRVRLARGVVDLLRQEVQHDDGSSTRLSTMEVELLSYLAARPGRVVSRYDLLREVWDHGSDSLSRAVDKTMNRLRVKVERDPARPEHLVTVHGEGYRFVPLPDAPEAPTLPAGGRLPVPLDRFVGRSSELEDIAALLGEHRLVTILGPGGIGKTRLAGEVARRTVASGEWPGAAWFVDLSGVHRQDAVAPAIARLLDVQASGGQAPIEAVVRALATAPRALLVLDNLEQVGDGLDAFVVALLSGVPDLHVLATSRRSINVAGEQIVELGPLDGADSTALYAARASRRGLPAEPGSVTALVTRLDGIPLAIELAAARSGTLSAGDLLARLDRGLSTLGTAPAGGPARHRTLEAAIAGSWDALTDDEQAGLAAMASFPAGFGLDAIEALLDDADVLDVVARLRDCSLVRARPAGSGWRFELFSTIRAFVLARRAPSEALIDRQIGWLADLATRLVDALDGPEAHSALDRLADEHRNLEGAAAEALARRKTVAATRLALAVEPIEASRGCAAPPTLELLLACVVDGPPDALRAALETRLGLALWFSGERQRGVEFALRAAASAAGGPTDAAATVACGAILLGESRVDESEALLRDGLARGGGDPRAEGALLAQLGVVLNRTGRPDQAVPVLERANALLETTGQVVILARSAANLAFALRRAGRPLDAVTALTRALAMSPPRGDRFGVALKEIQLGLLLANLGRFGEGWPGIERGLDRLRALGRRRALAAQLGSVALALATEGRDDAADAALAEASVLTERWGVPLDHALLERNRACVGLRRSTPGATAMAERTAAALAGSFEPILEAGARGLLAAAGALEGATPRAEEQLMRARALNAGGTTDQLLDFYAGFVAAARGDLAAAQTALDAALDAPLFANAVPLVQLVPEARALSDRLGGFIAEQAARS